MLLPLLQNNLLGSGTIAVVPDVVGLTEAAAIAAIVGANLLADIQSGYSTAIAVGIVISQGPAAGTVAAVNDTVSFKTSLGPSQIAQIRFVPHFSFMRFRPL